MVLVDTEEVVVMVVAVMADMEVEKQEVEHSVRLIVGRSAAVLMHMHLLLLQLPLRVAASKFK